LFRINPGWYPDPVIRTVSGLLSVQRAATSGTEGLLVWF